MSIADTIQSIKNHTKEAYDTAETKGATLPEKKNLANLSAAIAQLDKIDVVQETGDSETAVMSQKATTDAINGIEVPKTDTYIATSNSAASIINGFVQDSVNKGVRISIKAMNTSTGQSSVGGDTLKEATPTSWGVMSPSDKSKLDSLLEIKSLNESLELDENGQLSVVGGGGSDVNLLTAYTATVGDNDVYDAAYVNNQLNNGSVRLGAFAAAPVNRAVSIGANAIAQGSSVTAIGYTAQASHADSVALGAISSTGRSKEVSIGGNSYTRFLANVTAGELPTDAVNLQQMQDYVAEHSGSDYLLPEYVVGNSTNVDPVAYTTTVDTVTTNVARFNTSSEAALNPALVEFPMATTTHAGAMSSADKTTLENLPNNYYTKTEIDAMIGDINEAIVKLDTGTGV